MNTTITRAAVAVFLLGIAWGFGYYVGADQSGVGRRRSDSSKLAAPILDAAPSKSSSNLSSTSIGRVIDGKADFHKQLSLHQYAESLEAAAMPEAINEAMQLPLRDRNDALRVLFSRWAELDPAAAAEYTNLLPRSA